MCRVKTPKIPDMPEVPVLPAPIIPEEAESIKSPAVRKSQRRAAKGVSRLRIPLSGLRL